MMDRKKFLALKAGDIVKLTSDTKQLVNTGIGLTPGIQVQVARTDFGNNRVWIQAVSASGTQYYAVENDLEDVQQDGQPKPKPSRFDKAAVEEIRKLGGNTHIRTAITTKVHEARNCLNNCLVTTPTDQFNPEIKKTDELLRQAKLLHKLLQK